MVEGIFHQSHPLTSAESIVYPPYEKPVPIAQSPNPPMLNTTQTVARVSKQCHQVSKFGASRRVFEDNRPPEVSDWAWITHCVQHLSNVDDIKRCVWKNVQTHRGLNGHVGAIVQLVSRVSSFRLNTHSCCNGITSGVSEKRRLSHLYQRNRRCAISLPSQRAICPNVSYIQSVTHCSTSHIQYSLLVCPLAEYPIHWSTI